MDSKLLTIVIPVYKVEKYIRQCMDSVIVPQTEMEQLEVIVVNDGTPDNSAKIAREYAEQYPETIRVIDKENGGHGSAWNVGLKMATGKYIRFLDSDDWLSDLSVFISRLETLDVDLVFTHFNKYYDSEGIQEVVCLPSMEYDKVLSIDSIPYDNIRETPDLYNFHRCTYNTKKLQEDQPLFCERVYYDDGILYVVPLVKGKSVCFLDMPLYNYRLSREGQTMERSVEMAHAYDYVQVCKGIIEFTNNHTDISEYQREQEKIILQAYLTYPFRLFTALPYKEFKKAIKEWLPIIDSYSGFNLTRKMQLCQFAPSFVSWALIRLFDKVILKNR